MDAIGQGLSARINPLAFGPLGAGWEQLGRDEVQRRVGIVFSRWPTRIRGPVGSQNVGDRLVAARHISKPAADDRQQVFQPDGAGSRRTPRDRQKDWLLEDEDGNAVNPATGNIA